MHVAARFAPALLLGAALAGCQPGGQPSATPAGDTPAPPAAASPDLPRVTMAVTGMS